VSYNIKNFNNEEIDISSLLKKSWYFRKLIVFGSLIIGALSLFILVLFNYTKESKNYTETIIQGDLGSKNSLIAETFKSNEIIDDTLKALSIDMSANQFSGYMVIHEKTNPLSKSIQERITSLTDKDIRTLSLTKEGLNSIVESLNNSSEDLFTIRLYHVSLDLSDDQAINIIEKIATTVNKKIILNTNISNSNYSKIDTSHHLNLFGHLKDYNIIQHSEVFDSLNSILESIQKNLSNLNKDYSKLLVNTDFEYLNYKTQVAQKILYETARKFGNYNSLKMLNVKIRNKDREIESLRQSLGYLDRSIPSQQVPNKNGEANKSTNNTPLDVNMFDRILTLGSILVQNEFRLNSLKKIQLLEREKNVLLTQKELFELPYTYSDTQLNIEYISPNIVLLADKVNAVINDVLLFTHPDAAFKFVQKPMLVNININSKRELLEIAIILTIISFFCLIFISFFLKIRKKEK